MNDRLSNAIARWLSHPTGVLQGLLTTAAWFSIPWFFHWSFAAVVFWYLAYCTFVSYETQFTLAYQNKKAELHMLNMMRLLVAFAEEAKREQDEQGRDHDEIAQRIKADPSTPFPVPPPPPRVPEA